MIYTSYFGNWRNFPKNSLVAAITRYPPKSWTKLTLEFLAPSVSLLNEYKNHQIDEFMFKVHYLQELQDRNLTPQYVNWALNKCANGRDLILCCYEKPTDFCHRHILAEWLGGVKEL